MRELQEELAIAVSPVRKVWENETASGVRLHWWLVTSSDEPTPNPEEVAECMWMTAQELADEQSTLATNLGFLKAMDNGEFDLRS